MGWEGCVDLSMKFLPNRRQLLSARSSEKYQMTFGLSSGNENDGSFLFVRGWGEEGTEAPLWLGCG